GTVDPRCAGAGCLTAIEEITASATPQADGAHSRRSAIGRRRGKEPVPVKIACGVAASVGQVLGGLVNRRAGRARPFVVGVHVGQVNEYALRRRTSLVSTPSIPHSLPPCPIMICCPSSAIWACIPPRGVAVRIISANPNARASHSIAAATSR